MKGNKIIATLVVLAMVLSTLVVININLVEKANVKAPYEFLLLVLVHGEMRQETWNTECHIHLFPSIHQNGLE